MNHKHVKTTWTINMWKNVTTDHYSMISGNNFPNMNCIAVIGYKLQNGDIVFSFLCFFFFSLFSFFSFFFFVFVFSFFFSWVSRQWDNLHLVFNWENVSWGQKCFFSFFLFFLFFSFSSFLTKKCKNMKNNEKMCLFFEKKRKSYTCCKGVPGAMCCGKLYDSLRFGGILDPSLVWSVARFHFNFSAHPCRLQPMVLWPVRPNVIEKSTQWCQEWILSLCPCLVRPLHCLSLPVLNRADFVLMDRWGTLLRCYTWPKTTLVPDVPFLSVVVRPRGQRCQNKISFDRLQPEQIKQDEVKSFEFYLFICIFISCYVYLFLFMCIYFFLCIFMSFYFLLFLFISIYFFLFLFIVVYFFLFLFISLFWRKKKIWFLNVFFLIFGSSKPCCN